MLSMAWLKIFKPNYRDWDQAEKQAIRLILEIR